MTVTTSLTTQGTPFSRLLRAWPVLRSVRVKAIDVCRAAMLLSTVYQHISRTGIVSSQPGLEESDHEQEVARGLGG